MRILVSLPLLCAVAVLSSAAAAAQADGAAPPVVVVSASATKVLPADRALLVVAVETIAPTSVVASRENARIFQNVLDALRAAGVPKERISTSGFSVERNMVYSKERETSIPKGFAASNSIRIETTELDKVGSYIDAALKGGATSVSDIEFTASGVDSARRVALAQAIVNARADAEAMARAAGGSLGKMLQVSTEADDQSGIRRLGYSELQLDSLSRSKVMPREILVSATVFTRWQLRLP